MGQCSGRVLVDTGTSNRWSHLGGDVGECLLMRGGVQLRRLRGLYRNNAEGLIPHDEGHSEPGSCGTLELAHPEFLQRSADVVANEQGGTRFQNIFDEIVRRQVHRTLHTFLVLNDERKRDFTRLWVVQSDDEGLGRHRAHHLGVDHREDSVKTETSVEDVSYHLRPIHLLHPICRSVGHSHISRVALRKPPRRVRSHATRRRG